MAVLLVKKIGMAAFPLNIRSGTGVSPQSCAAAPLYTSLNSRVKQPSGPPDHPVSCHGTVCTGSDAAGTAFNESVRTFRRRLSAHQNSG